MLAAKPWYKMEKRESSPIINDLMVEVKKRITRPFRYSEFSDAIATNVLYNVVSDGSFKKALK